MLPLRLFVIMCFALTTSSSANAQISFAVTGGSGACASEGKTSVNMALQEAVTLKAQIGQAERLLLDVSAMENCAGRQMVWVPGHPTHDADGCISVEEFRGEPGDTGPQGDKGSDATCP